MSGAEVGEHTQPEERQQQRRQGRHIGAPPDVVAHCLVFHAPSKASQSALGWPEAHPPIEQIGRERYAIA